MQTIGLLGGMSWESSAEYYRLVNERVRDELGSPHSADCLLRSVDFAEIEAMQRAGEWEEAGRVLAAEALALERAGADLIGLCTNTRHKVAAQIEATISVPFVDLIDVLAAALRDGGVDRAALLATAYTMEDGFYTERLEAQGIEALVPEAAERAEVHRVIYEELTQGVVRDESRAAYRAVTAGLVERGAEAVILGCTEIGMLIGEGDASVPVFDTTHLHAERLVQLALREG